MNTKKNSYNGIINIFTPGLFVGQDCTKMVDKCGIRHADLPDNPLFMYISL